jgi:5-methylcytosine-specific restriction endonuclease McrA
MAVMAKRGDPRLSRDYKKFRLQVLARDQWSCFYCSAPATTVDHIIPVSKAPDLVVNFENAVACCTKCNSSKGSRNQAAFLGKKPTPPVFLKPSLPETIRTVPDSPFNKPDTLDFDAK